MASIDSANPSSTPPANPRRRWNRADRNRLFIFLGIAFFLPVPLLYAVHFGLADGRSESVRKMLPAKAITVVFVSLATWVVSRMEKRPLSDYGIPFGKALGSRFAEGLVWGFAMLSALLLILRESGHFAIDSVSLTGDAALRYAAAWGVGFLLVGLSEEFSFRGYLLFACSRSMTYWRAAVWLSVCFGVAHLFNPGENALGIVQVVEFGLLMCLTIRRTGNLWFAVGFHAAWDWAETFFYGTPDSGLLGIGRFLNTSVHGPNWLTGGSAGPEGSLLVVPLLALCALLIHLRFPKASYPDRPA